jgi:ring-1,2-phenylacetyl-CoA epoxidase subunit PaaD
VVIVVTEQQIREAIYEVRDPEIPTLSVIDMGIITGIEVNDDGSVNVTMTPTFVGCPAIDVMRADVEAAVRNLGVSNVSVTVNFTTPWSTNLLTEKGKKALLKHGLAPPDPFHMELELDVLHSVKCPHCDSMNTELKSPFGPTLCRSLHYCHDCLQAFEGFKPI